MSSERPGQSVLCLEVDVQPVDEEAFRSFVAARSAPLLRSAYAITADHALAEDLLQTALVRTYASWSGIRDPQAAEAYVKTTMSRTAVSWSRRRSWGERPTARLPDRQTVDVEHSVGERDVLDRALRQLSPRQRAVLALRYFEDLSCEQTADQLGCSVGSVKQHTARALAALRRLMPADDGSEHPVEVL